MHELAAFEWLPGRWDLSRTISDGSIMLGQAEFEPRTPGVLHYLETGRLTLSSGYSGEAYREYYYSLEEDHIHVSFADCAPGERTFLRLRPVTPAAGSYLQAQDTHLCSNDVYEATYIFESARRAVITIRVNGPEKDYTIRTILTRPVPASS